MMTPVSGSSPPQALSGSVSLTVRPWACPATKVVAGMVRSEADMIGDLSLHCGFDAGLQVGEAHVDANVAGRVPGPFGGIRHDQPIHLAQNRGVVGAGVGDDADTGGVQRCRDTLPGDGVVDPSAGVDVQRGSRVYLPPGEEIGQSV